MSETQAQVEEAIRSELLRLRAALSAAEKERDEARGLAAGREILLDEYKQELGSVLARLSAAEKREARPREALAAMMKERGALGGHAGSDSPAEGLARTALLEASRASEAQPPPASAVPIASSTQEGEK